MGSRKERESIRDRIKNSSKNRPGITVWEAPQSTSTEQASTQQMNSIRDRIKNSAMGTADTDTWAGLSDRIQAAGRERSGDLGRAIASPALQERKAEQAKRAEASIDAVSGAAPSAGRNPDVIRRERDQAKWDLFFDNLTRQYTNPTLSGEKAEPSQAQQRYDALQRELETQERRLREESPEIQRQRQERAKRRISLDQEAQELYRTAQTSGSGEQLVQRMIDNLDKGGAPEDDPSALADIATRYGVSPETSGSVSAYMNDLNELLRTGDLSDRVNPQTSAIEELAKQGYDFQSMEQYRRDQEAAEEAARRAQETEALAEEHPVLSSAASIFAAPLQGLDYLDMALRSIGHSDPTNLNTYRPINTDRTHFTNFVSTVRSTVGENIEEGTDSEILGGAARFLYDTVMSIGDSALQVAMLGPASIATMGGAAAANTTADVLARGGSSEQALWAGAAAGVAEAFFEKFSVDKLLSTKSASNLREFVGEVAKQAGVEASEGSFTEIANILSDAVIMGQRSDFTTLVEGYKAQGLSEEQAKERAFLAMTARVALSGLGGALSGGFMGGGAASLQRARTWAADNLTGKALRQSAENFRLVELGLSFAPDSESYRMAADMARRLDESTTGGKGDIRKAVTDAEYGQLARIMEAERENKGPSDVQEQVEVAQAARPEEKVASPTMQAFLEAGDSAADAETKAGVLDRILSGDTTLTNTQLRKLKLNTQASRAVFENLTGVPVPRTMDTKTLIATARTAAERAAAREPATENAAVQRATAPAAEPAAAFMQAGRTQDGAGLTAQLQSEPEATAQATAPAAEPAAAFMPMRASGAAGLEAAQTARRTDEPAAAFMPAAQRETTQSAEAFMAQLEREAVEAARAVEAERGADGGRFSVQQDGQTSENAKKPTREQEWTAKYAAAMLKGTSVKNVRVAFEGFGDRENAYYQDGEIVLNGDRLTTQRAINYILGHELTHPGADADANLVQSILDLGDRLLGGDIMSTRMTTTRERYIRSYMRNHGMNRTQAEAKVTPELAKEETAADLMAELFETPGALERMGRESAGAKVLRAARDALRRMLGSLTGKGSQSAQNEAEMLLERLNRALRSRENRGTMEQKEARSSVGGEENSPDYRGRQDAGRAGGEEPVRAEYRTAREGAGRDGRGDLGISDGALISTETRAAAAQKDMPNLELRETLERAAFSAALERAKTANPNGGMVDSQSVEHLDETGARTFMREDGLAGVAVEADGNIVGVFKNPSLRVYGAVNDLLLTAIAQGGTHLDCYVTGGKHDLASKYTQMGFIPVAWLSFNREYAPDGWDYEAWGEPDVVMWVHSGESALEVAQRSGTYPFFSTEYIHSLPQFEDYDAAKELQAQKVKEITEARKSGRRYSISSEQPFAEQVTRALTEDPTENWYRALYIRETPITLRGIGLGDLPLTITTKHIRNINHAEDPSGQHPEWHGIDKETLIRLPQLLERPVVIMDSATVPGDVVVVTAEVDDHGRPVVASIRPNGTAYVDGKVGPANFITSIYGRNGYTAWVNQAVRDGRVLYWNKNRSQNLSVTGKVQFPASLTGLAPNTIIKRHAGYVKDNIPERRFSVDMDSEGQWLSDEQKEFFKDSKAVDEDGNLLLMYHGTNADKNFTRFDTYGGHFGLFGLGSYFTDNRSVADSYTAKGRGTNPRVYEVYLNIKNPLDMDAPFRPEEWSDVDPDILDYFRDANTNEDMFRGLKEYCQDEMMYRDEAEEFITDFIIERGYDGITHIGGGRYGSKDGPRHRVFIAFEPEQIKSANNRTPTDDPDIRYSVSEGGQKYNSDVVLEPETIDRYLRDYAAKSSPKYAQAYIAHMRPDDFLRLTTSADGRSLVEQTSRPLDIEQLGNVSREQPIQLNIDHETGEVIGHEGRHRAVALSREGVKRIPVLLFDSTNKYNKTPMDRLKLTGQDFGASRSYASAYANDLVPLSYENRDLVVRKFATLSAVERAGENLGRDTIRYSVSDEDINPDTGYRRGSIEDSFMRIVKAGDEQRALDMLQSMLERMAAFEATRAERSNPADAFRPKPELTEDLVAKNRAAIQSLIDKYGRMEQTRTAARRVNFPNQIDDDTKVRGVVRTAASAKATPEALVSEFERSILDGDAGYTYVPISDKSVLDKINGRIEQRGFSAELREWRAAIDSNKSMTKEDIARGEQLYVEACANKDLETAQQLVAELAMIGTQYGQVIQAISMLHKLSPTGQLYYLQKTVEHMTREYDKLGKDIDVLIDPELAKQLLEAGTKEEIDAAVDQIISDIAEQLPVTIWDKWDAWRYLAMLGNPTTHVRNMLSNAVFTPVRMAKDLVGTALETAFIRDRGQRTKGFATREAREFAKADAQVMQDILRTGGKHNITDRIRDARKIFKLPPLEWARTKNTAALEAEDWLAMRGAYVNALSGFLSARNADLNTLQGEGETREGRRLLNEARAYAVLEAQKATYRDMNTMASILNQFRRAKNPFVRFAFGGLLPFTKTPFNIVRRGVEYSPLGLIGTLRTALTGGSAAEILDRLSASFTGTGLMVAGYFLAKAGLLIGGIGDDPEDEFEKLQGVQAYSFQYGDHNYTIDWLAPTVLPLFVGAELHRLTEGDAEAEDAYEAMMTILEPVMALSMMSGLNDTLAAVRYEDQEEMVVAMLRNMVGSYFTQGVPTILGRIARTMDDSRRTSFVSADAAPTESWLSRTFQSSVLGKIPVASEDRMLYIDAWGRTDTQENAGIRALENFLSPGYYNKVQTTAVDEELMRLAEATNSTAVFPKRAEKSFTVDGEAYAMTQEEYQEHLIERGQTSYQLVSDLISSPAYAGMSDDEKALAVKKCYDYAAQLAKLHTNSDYNANPWVAKLEQMTKEGLDADDYFTAYAMSENQGQNMKEIISATDRYNGPTAALLMAMDFDAADFTDPYASRYEYKLTDGQRETYRGLFVERLSSEMSYLMSDDWYLDASAEDRLEMLDETWSDVKDEVKRDMADWLWDHGIESTEKE